MRRMTRVISEIASMRSRWSARILEIYYLQSSDQGLVKDQKYLQKLHGLDSTRSSVGVNMSIYDILIPSMRSG